MAPVKPRDYAQDINNQLRGTPHVSGGRHLAKLFDVSKTPLTDLYKGLSPGEKAGSEDTFARTFRAQLPRSWPDAATAHARVLVALNLPQPNIVAACTYQHELVLEVYKIMLPSSDGDNATGWLLPLLYTVCRDLKRLAIEADGVLQRDRQKVVKLEMASRLLQKCFAICLNDRSPSSEQLPNRKAGTYYLAVLLFKVYFKLGSTALCKNIINGIGAVDLPPFNSYPMSHQVSYRYYLGVFAFLREDYAEAERMFLDALKSVHRKALRNRELILDYLIPILMLRGVHPTKELLGKSNRLSSVYVPFLTACRTGNVAMYDDQLQKAERRLMERGTYLIVERAREVAVRGLMKKAWILHGKGKRMKIDDFRRVYQAGSGDQAVDSDEVECLLANMIHKGTLKGYISHEAQTVVLGLKPFPWYGVFADRGPAAKKARDDKEQAERDKPGVDTADRPSAGQPEELWSTILDSTPKSGKSTLLSRLASPTGEAPVADDEAGAGASAPEVLDLGLSYSSFDVRDEADEETVARLGAYQLPSPSPPYPSLLPLALSRSTLLDSLAVIVLDWERPWRFLKELRAWLGVLEGVLKGKGVAEGWEGQEARDRLEAHLRHYAEPPAGGTAASGTASASVLADTDAPLPSGVLTDNPGLGLVIVCTKADQINSLERDKDYKEEQFDYVQQTLRTIALKYGAAVFFTSHSRPPSFARLRAYLLHRLFAQPSSSSAVAPGAAPATTSNPTSSRAFPFPHRANVVDRDQVLVPTGWDSWGKIRILRDRYDVDGVGQGWDLDMERETDRLAGRLSTEDEERLDSEGRRVISAIRMYEEVVVNLDSDDQPINMANSHVEVQNEQDFLKTHYETLQKDREKDPRAAFAARPTAGGAQNGELSYGASVVGPMASHSLNLPSVERALERDTDDVTARLAKMTRRESATAAGIRSPVSPAFSPTLGASPPLNGSTSPNLTSTLLTPTSSSGGTPAGGQASNEVLANFFQSLLEKRATTGGARPGVQGLASAAAPLSSSTTQRPTPPGGASLSRSSSQQNGT
ncbi:cytoplasmic dynein light intermediate chain 1 [Pseudohyphozyma bogoriensis]|nr:cytoplasmic dynein light intermediate chain 1 [Pseudohyphozyma bogoriensis]